MRNAAYEIPLSNLQLASWPCNITTLHTCDIDLRIDLFGDLAGILNMASGGKDMKNKTIIERLELSPSNDNSPQALQDRIGSGGSLCTLARPQEPLAKLEIPLIAA